LFRRHLFAGQTEIDILNNNKLARFDATPADFASLPPHTQDLLQNMLELDANKRISAAEALQHRVFANVGGKERAARVSEGETALFEAEPTE
jgi:serine/threonine protein kinase